MAEVRKNETLGNLTNLSTSFDPKYALREPTIEDVANLAGVLARGIDDEVMSSLLDGANEAAMAAIFSRAIGDAAAREDLLFVLGSMWTYDPEVDNPPEEWEYNPEPSLVEKGQAISREERWRAISKINRKRIIKRYMVAKLPFRRLKDMWLSIKDVVQLDDFLGMALGQHKERSGQSMTGSQPDMDGQTER